MHVLSPLSPSGNATGFQAGGKGMPCSLACHARLRFLMHVLFVFFVCLLRWDPVVSPDPVPDPGSAI
jgi:hypothetical protein